MTSHSVETYVANPVEDFIRAESIEQALEVRAKFGSECYPLVGGTDLLVLMRAGRWSPRVILDLSRIPGFADIRQTDSELVFGAGATAADCLANEFIRTNFPAMYKSCAWLGGPQIQNAGSLGGNMATASPAGDTVPCVIALEGTVVLKSKRGERTVSAEEFAIRPRKTVMEEDELIAEIRVPLANLASDPRGFQPDAMKVPKLHTVVPRPPFGSGGAPDSWMTNDFLKAGPRLAQVISIVSMAGFVEMSGPRTVKRLRLAFGCAGPKTMMGKSASAVVEGKELTEELIEEAVRAVQQDITPLSDVRGTAEYKRMLCSNYARLFLQDVGGFKLTGTRKASETLA